MTHVCSNAKVEHTRAEHTDPSVTTQTQINDEQQGTNLQKGLLDHDLTVHSCTLVWRDCTKLIFAQGEELRSS